jgi:hypothetical protein
MLSYCIYYDRYANRSAWFIHAYGEGLTGAQAAWANRKYHSHRTLLRFDYAASVYHMSWDYHVVMMSLVPDYSTSFHTTSHSDSYYYRD